MKAKTASKSKYANHPEHLCSSCLRRYTRHPSCVCMSCMKGGDRQYAKDPCMDHECKGGWRLGVVPRDEDANARSDQ